MFTGIIEEIGIVQEITRIGGGQVFKIEAERVLEDLSPDDSVAVNGVCLTATDVIKPSFRVTAVDETLKKTTLTNLRVGESVNLERALQLGDRLGGHLVQGHVDSTAKILSVQKKGAGFAMEIAVPSQLMKYIIDKGSVCIDGISLTVAGITSRSVQIAVIPHTVNNTTLKTIQVGTEVNVEVDLLAKYVENSIQAGPDGKSHDLSWYRSQGY